MALLSFQANTAEARKGATTPVTAYPNGVSPFGVFDMAKNVWEWCKDTYGKDYRRLRGGSWVYTADVARAACRILITPDSRNFNLGIRCEVVPQTSPRE